MKWNVKWLTGLVAMIYAVVTPLIAAYGYYLERNWYPAGHPDLRVIEADMARTIRRAGPSSDLDGALQRMAETMGWVASYVSEASPPTVDDAGDNPILAASNSEWAGRSWAEVQAQANVEAELWRGTINRVFEGEDGHQYVVWAIRDLRSLPWVPWNRAAGILAVAAWLTLATWLNYDVRDRSGGRSAGWVLLGLLAGPVALAVWLIARPGLRGERMEVCPGCGHDTPEGAPFCVKCGFALRPSCPRCHRPAGYDWEYCAACGQPLAHETDPEGVEAL